MCIMSLLQGALRCATLPVWDIIDAPKGNLRLREGEMCLNYVYLALTSKSYTLLLPHHLSQRVLCGLWGPHDPHHPLGSIPPSWAPSRPPTAL